MYKNRFRKYLLSIWQCLTLACCALLMLMPLMAMGCDQKPTLDRKGGEQTPATPTLKLTEFDGQRALEHVRKQVAFGPHYAGSPAIKQVREYIKKELESYGLKVREDAFKAKTPNPKFPEVEMVNLIAEVPGSEKGIMLVASHYDTKWFEDMEFVGANDGGSSTAVLIEMARHLAKSKPKYTLWLTFFDGEEAMNGEWEGTDHTYGSRYMADQIRAGKLKDIKGLVLLDMIGDKGLNIRRDNNSINWMNDIIWQTAEKLGYQKQFINEIQGLEDDHIPFMQVGVPSVDIIDFDYGLNNQFWHTSEDTTDKISAESLKAVGDTVITSLPALMDRLK